MRLSPPTVVVWLVAVVLGVLGIILQLGVIALPEVTRYVSSFWLVAAGFVLLALATLLKGL